MNQSPTRKVVRRVTLALIITLQSAHFILQVLDLWSCPRKPYRKLATLGRLYELDVICKTCFRITEGSVDVKLGRSLIRGFGTEALLWAIAMWSALCVGYDVLVLPNSSVSLAQLAAVDVFWLMSVLSSAVGLVERNEGGDQTVVDEKEKLMGKEEV